MKKRATECPVCKKHTLQYSRTHVFCEDCHAYRRELKFREKIDHYTYTANPWVRLVGFIPILFLAISTTIRNHNAISNIIARTDPEPLTSIWWGFIYNMNLGIHELGHYLFILLGNDTLTRVMGSGMELLFALLVVAGFFQVRYYFMAMASFIYLGFTLNSIAIYMADAEPRVLQLVALTFDEDERYNAHDWWNLFSDWGVLEQADVIARIVQIVGVVCIVFGISACSFLIYRMFKNKADDPTVR